MAKRTGTIVIKSRVDKRTNVMTVTTLIDKQVVKQVLIGPSPGAMQVRESDHTPILLRNGMVLFEFPVIGRLT